MSIKVEISTKTRNPIIRYTTDNTEVTETSPTYTEPVIGDFMVIRSKVYKENYTASNEIIKYLYKCEDPIITQNNDQISISCSTPESIIYYRLGESGDFVKYETLFEITENVIIYAYATAQNYEQSNTVNRNCTLPQINNPSLNLSRSGETINGTLSNTETNATYVYKIGSIPSSQSDGTVISGTTFSLNNSAAVTIYVRGFRKGYLPSTGVSARIDAYDPPQCATPSISCSNNTVTITCSTPNATIYYRKGSTGNYSTGSSPVTFTITSTITVYAYANATGYVQSNTTNKSCTYTAPKCATPSISQSGNTVTFTCSTSGVTIHYSGCGRSGTCSSGGSVSITQSGTMTAYATASGYSRSSTASKSCTYTAPKCATPSISCSNNVVTITCSTSGATIYYRRGTSGGYSVYSGPFSITSTVTVYAYATRSGYSQSSTTSKSCSYVAPTPTVSTPTIKQTTNSNSITITCSTSGATIKYRIKPASTGTYGSYQTYTGSFKVTEDCTISAYATRSGYNQSGSRTFTATYKTEIPLETVQHGLTISSGEPALGTIVSVGIQPDAAINFNLTINNKDGNVTKDATITAVCGSYSSTTTLTMDEMQAYVGTSYTVRAYLAETDTSWGFDRTISGTYEIPQLDTPTLTLVEENGKVAAYINKSTAGGSSYLDDYPDNVTFIINYDPDEVIDDGEQGSVVGGVMHAFKTGGGTANLPNNNGKAGEAGGDAEHYSYKFTCYAKADPYRNSNVATANWTATGLSS